MTKNTRHGKAPRLTPRALIQALEQDVTARGLVLTREAYARERQGQVLCGVLDIYWRPIGAWGCAVALRYAPEERLALRLAPGLRLREGDHLLCTGDLVPLTRRQLVCRDLAAVLARGMGRCLAGYAAAGPQVERLRQTTLTMADAQAWMYPIFLARLVLMRLFQAVAWTYAHTMEAQGPTLWTLHRAFAAHLQRLPSTRALRANVALGQWFLQQPCEERR